MRTVYLINQVTRTHVSQYSADHFNDALEDLEANGYKAIDIKFDMDGDIVISVIPIIWGKENDQGKHWSSNWSKAKRTW